MSESTQADGTAASPTNYAYCSWHQGYSDTARVVQVQDQGSAFGTPGLHACADCRDVYSLIPLADQP